MSDRLIRRALRMIPLQTRMSEGEAIRDMAVDMVESGASSELKEARGIAAYGLKKRAGLEIEWAQGLLWNYALWLLVLPIASVQLAMVVAPLSPSSGLPNDTLALIIWYSVVGFSVVAMGAGAFRSRAWLRTGAGGLLAMLVADLCLARGSSLVFDAQFHISGTSFTISGSLILIPTTLLLCAASLVEPRRSDPAMSWRSLLTTFAFLALPIAVVIDSLSQNGASANQLDGLTQLQFVMAGVVYLAWTSHLRGREERGLAAGLLIVSQSPVLALLFATVVLHAINLPDSVPFGPGVACVAIATGWVLTLAAARELVRKLA